MAVDPKFLRSLQDKGWIVESVEADHCVVKCPADGCSMRAKVKAGPSIPERCNTSVERERAARLYDDARKVLRRRRQDLLLSTTEVEESAGLASAHIAKSERPDFTRVPTFDTVAMWAAALGYEIVFKPTDLPPMTLRFITDSRNRTADRRRRVAQDPARSPKRPGKAPD